MKYLVNDKTGEYLQVPDDIPVRFLTEKGSELEYSTLESYHDIYRLSLEAYYNNRWIDVYIAGPPISKKIVIDLVCEPAADIRDIQKYLEQSVRNLEQSVRNKDGVLKSIVTICGDN